MRGFGRRVNFYAKMIMRSIMFRLLKCKAKYLVFSPFLILFLYFIGVFSMMVESSFENFKYPLEINILPQVEHLRHNGSPIITPVNFYNYSYVYNCKEKCMMTDTSKLRVVYIVKSAVENFVKRAAIRKTWGYEKRFSDVPIRTLFMLGETSDTSLQSRVAREYQINRDIIQGAFKDSYYNNTIKTMMAMKWAITYCPISRFYFFVDDDYYVSTKNLLKFLRNPVNYPSYLEIPLFTMEEKNPAKKEGSGVLKTRVLNQVLDIDLPDDAELYSGFVFDNSRPQRHMFSKWYVPISEYPYNRYPPYVTAGAFVLSREALFKMYFASFYTQHFRFDDIYLALLAKKVNIDPLHSSEFYFYKKKYSAQDYRYVVASHGYGNPTELQEVWNEQKAVGNA